MARPYARLCAGTLVVLLAHACTSALAQDTTVIAGQNINMVAGTEWPDGDPFLQRQNEPTISVSTRNELHLMGGSNDYRTVDLPGLPEGKETGDSWLSAYFSYDGGGRWKSNLLPGYPQDTSPEGLASPLKIAGYEASADPVIRSGTHGLFYYSGIAFTRGDAPPSAGFVATFIDLNNNERGDTVHYVDTTLFDRNDDGTSFIDKPWIAVDKPRAGSATLTIDVPTDDGVVPQTVQCGSVYAAYARIQGEGGAAVSSQIMFTKSEDCARTWSEPVELTLPDTINQGAFVAVEPNTGRVQVAWRQFENATLNCTRPFEFWGNNPEAWPVDEIEIAGVTVLKEDAADIMFRTGEYSDGGWPPKVLRHLVATWLNLLSGADADTISDTVAEAETWMIDNPLGSKPKGAIKDEGNRIRKLMRDFNAGVFGPGNCDALLGDGTTDLLSGMNPNAILVASSSDFGETFSAPVTVSSSSYSPFEQGTTEYSFRTTGYPTMVFDGDGRSYVAYTTRGLAVPDFDAIGGDGRIVVTTSTDGINWTVPMPIDEPEQRGHQLMPALEFIRGKLFLLYYDFREDVSGVFDRFVVDLPVDLTTPRHSVDVRVAQALPSAVPVFADYSVLDGGSTQTSRYPFVMLSDETNQPFSQQTQYNPPNLPMFKGGLVPFFGDFIDIAGLRFILDGAGQWQFNTDPGLGAPVVHAVWTDNRDVEPPPDGDWTSYVPPGDGSPRTSIFDPTQTVPACDPGFDPTVFDRTRMRNQNIYTSRITEGLSVALPGNNRPLGIIQRAFVAFVQNLTGEDKAFRLEILNQPPGGSASFEQFALQTSRDEVVERGSSISRSIFVGSTDPSASVDILVTEIDEFGVPVVGGLTGTARINADPTAPVPLEGNILNEETYTPAIFNPAIFNPAIFNSALLGDPSDPNEIGILSPAIFNPAIFNNPEDAEQFAAALANLAILNPAIFNPAIFNPAIFNPAIFNPAIFNPAIFNPAIFNPAIFNPAIFNPAIFNPAIFNPAIFNPAIFNPAIFNSTLVETSAVIQNQGNSTAAYSLNLDLDNPPAGFLFQVMIYRTYLVPTVVGCTITETVEQEIIVNELTPDVAGSLLNPDSTSFYIEPGSEVVVNVRIVPDPTAPGDPATIDTLPELNLSQSVVPQAVDTEGVNNGETEPPPVIILAPSVPPLLINAVGLSNAVAGTPYSQTLGTTGGGGSPVTWELVPGTALPIGLSLTASGQITGTPPIAGVYLFDVRAKDDDQVAEQGFSITVDPGGLPSLPLVSEESTLGADTLTFDPATGLRWLDVTLSTPYSYDELLLQLQPGGLFERFRLGTSAEVQTFWQSAGIDTSVLGTFVPQNLQPVIDLMAFVGITGINTGNLGGGNFFDFTAGHVESGPGGGGNVTVGTIAADPTPTATGRADFGTVPSNNPNNEHGAWLTYGGSITNVTFSSTNLEIEGPTVSYTAELSNVTGITLAPATVVQGWIDQGTASRAAGGTQVFCGAGTGEFPPGSCSIPFSLGANNTTSAGTGTLVPGPATARLELIVDGIVFYTFRAPITLSAPGSNNWRADFDLSAETPAGPYTCLRHQFTFSDFIPVGEGFTLQMFDVDGGPVIGTWNFVNNFTVPINNVGNEVFLSGTALADGVGFNVISFTQPNTPALDVQGRVGLCTGTNRTNFVPAIMTPLP